MKKECEEIGSGYLRKDGRLGIRNRLLVLYTSECASFTAREIVSSMEGAAIDLIGVDRCVTSDFIEMKLMRYATHPNIGAVLVVQNGCDAISGEEIAEAASASGREVKSIVIQKDGGIAASIKKGREFAEKLLQRLEMCPKAALHFSDLMIGSECGGSDFTSGLSANPLIGRFFDRMADLGATVLFEEMYEAVGLKDYLISRCANMTAKMRIADTYDKFFQSSESKNQFFITPGNMKGGLTTIEEKSMGAVIKSGTRPIQGVVQVGQRPSYPGLWMMDGMTDEKKGCGPYVSEDATSLLLYAACGTTLNLLTTGRGHLINTPVTPTLKITGNRQTMLHLQNDIDFDASPVLYQEKSLDSLTNELTELICRIVNGQLTKGEALGHQDGYINQEQQFWFSGDACGGQRNG